MDGQYWGSDDLDHEVVVLGDYFDQYVRDESTFLAMRSQLLVVANTFNTDPATALAMINGTTTVVVNGNLDAPPDLADEYKSFFKNLPTASQNAFLAYYKNGTYYPEGKATENEYRVGKFLVENAGSETAIAVGKAYAQHPEEVAAFCEVAMQTYALAPIELASADPNFVPDVDSTGRGQFGWGEMFGWLEKYSLSGFTSQKRENIRDGAYATYFAYNTEAKPLSISEAIEKRETVDDLRSPGIILAARDLSGSPVGTHQFLILVPEHPENFTNLVDLGDGTKGIIVAAYSSNGRLISAVNDFDDQDGDAALSQNDLDAAKELYNSKENTSLLKPDYSTIHRRIQLDDDRSVDDQIRAIILASENYKENERQYNIPYPKWHENLKGVVNNSSCMNSNSFAQSILRYVIDNPNVEDDIGWFFVLDACHSTRIGDSLFQ